MVTPLIMFDIIEAFEKRAGCPVCLLIRRRVRQAMNTILFEHIVSPHVHEAFRAGRGLCNVHAWQISKFNGALLNISIFYRGALNQVLGMLDGSVPAVPARGGLARLGWAAGSSSPLADHLEPTGPCVACEARRESQELHVRTIGEHISDERLTTAYRSSAHGLCLPHFRMALRHTKNADDHRILVEVQRAAWEKLLDELDTFKAMHDYRHTGERMGSEGNSWLRALKSLAGEEGVFGLDDGPA